MNAQAEARWIEERRHLQPLPSHRLPDYSEYQATVRKWSTIHFSRRTYSVPSRLIGKRVEVRQFINTVEIWHNRVKVCEFERIHGQQTTRIDYRHVIASLVRKPGAFAHYVHREEMFPSLIFRRAHDDLVARSPSKSPIEYLRLLQLATQHGEQTIENIVAQLFARHKSFDTRDIERELQVMTHPTPEQNPRIPDLTSYDAIFGIGTHAEVQP
jgi:hypothetical protein